MGFSGEMPDDLIGEQVVSAKFMSCGEEKIVPGPGWQSRSLHDTFKSLLTRPDLDRPQTAAARAAPGALLQLQLVLLLGRTQRGRAQEQRRPRKLAGVRMSYTRRCPRTDRHLILVAGGLCIPTLFRILLANRKVLASSEPWYFSPPPLPPQGRVPRVVPLLAWEQEAERAQPRPSLQASQEQIPEGKPTWSQTRASQVSGAQEENKLCVTMTNGHSCRTCSAHTHSHPLWGNSENQPGRLDVFLT